MAHSYSADLHFGHDSIVANAQRPFRDTTIHTFQGREADTVILLLGAPKASQHRARQWAASPPNIINVAVSRAKQNLYVVGSTASWAAAGTSLQVLRGLLARSGSKGLI